MNKIQHIGVLIALTLLMTGCASTGGNWYDDWNTCVIAGAVTGATAGAVIDDHEAAAIGAVGGAVIGGVICALLADDTVPEGDADGDGIVDSKDRCPNTPAGARVDARGCELDSDGDGVVDRLDKCPGTRKGTPVDNSGCKLAERFTLEGVNFHHDSARLTDGSMATLNDASRILVRHSGLAIEVAGHTDSQGSAEYNLDLSERRANSVRAYLVSKGANAGKLTARGYGESEPIADNGTREGRAKNRRVELRHN